MIKLVPDPTFDCLVRLTVPGLPEPVEVPMTFRHMAVSRADEWLKQAADKPSADAIAEIVCGWRGVMGEDGVAVEFSKETLAQLLANYVPASGEIIRAWMVGLTESRVKN